MAAARSENQSIVRRPDSACGCRTPCSPTHLIPEQSHVPMLWRPHAQRPERQSLLVGRRPDGARESSSSRYAGTQFTFATMASYLYRLMQRQPRETDRAGRGSHGGACFVPRATMTVERRTKSSANKRWHALRLKVCPLVGGYLRERDRRFSVWSWERTPLHGMVGSTLRARRDKRYGCRGSSQPHNAARRRLYVWRV